MNPTTKLLYAIGAAALASATPTSAAFQQRITVSTDEAPYATEQSMMYEATCPSGKYRLRFNQNDNRVEFDGPARTAVDLSTTPLGVTFMGKALHGKFYSTCPESGGIRVYFYGVEPKKGSTLKTVKYSVTIGSDGAIIHVGELVDEHASALNNIFLRKLQQ